MIKKVENTKTLEQRRQEIKDRAAAELKALADEEHAELDNTINKLVEMLKGTDFTLAQCYGRWNAKNNMKPVLICNYDVKGIKMTGKDRGTLATKLKLAVAAAEGVTIDKVDRDMVNKYRVAA